MPRRLYWRTGEWVSRRRARVTRATGKAKRAVVSEEDHGRKTRR